MEDRPSTFEGGACGEKEEAGEKGGLSAVETACDGDDDAGSGKRDDKGEEAA